jgi:D-alanyl-lipoteichoic acid acyltransferase DltB (MBOAT superfamily)
MLFNSIEFALFLPLVFLLYWFVFNRNWRWQNLLVVIVSYVFYGWWDWKFLILIAITSFCSWLCGIYMGEKSSLRMKDKRHVNRRWYFMLANIVLNLGILGFFKYYNFFVDSFVQAFGVFGFQLHLQSLKIILPVGISFYTFQALSYTIDVYRGDIRPTKDIIAFFAFISFFPQLVAGPIERATNLLPQFLRPRSFSYPQAVDGCRQMLWGFFKKVVVADNCALYVDLIFKDYQNRPASSLVFAAILFAFQIYGDFSGYSDIAIGSSKLFGISLMQNFAYPYFSRDIAEFWRRWHISLSTWFRDYVYIPLGGSRVGLAKQIRNVFVIFLLSGFWHGASWNFIIWGGQHALLFLPLLLAKKTGGIPKLLPKTVFSQNSAKCFSSSVPLL